MRSKYVMKEEKKGLHQLANPDSHPCFSQSCHENESASTIKFLFHGYFVSSAGLRLTKGGNYTYICIFVVPVSHNIEEKNVPKKKHYEKDEELHSALQLKLI